MDHPVSSETRRRFLRLPEVVDLVGINKTTIYKFISEGHFPAPRKIGRVSVWLEHEVQDWILAILLPPSEATWQHGRSAIPNTPKRAST